jgi:CelD/BcsL family acetyltransferase involved in cellulose biosynthesis
VTETVKAPASQVPRSAPAGTASAIASARRAAMADRYAIDSFAVEWRTLTELGSIEQQWRELAERALEPNVFYEPAFALAAAAVLGHGTGAVLVWSGTSPRRLLGLFPARIEKRRYGIRLPLLVGWVHPYAPFGVPLVEREAAEPVIAAWLAHIASDSRLPGLLLLPYLAADGPFGTALSALLRRAQIPAADFNRHRRALLAPPAAQRAHYLERSLSAHKLKELRRNGRRLAERGALMLTVATGPSAFGAAFDDFLALEADGWKGRAGTAAAGHAGIVEFMRAALCGLAQQGKAAISRMLVDGRAIAAAITLRSGHRAWFWKIAYDERFARYSPGVMLAVALSEDALDDEQLAEVDSCATANHPMIDHIWRERLTVCDLLVGLRPQAPFWLGRRLEMMRISVMAAAKRVRGRFRR